MIVIVTPNPAVDHTLVVPGLAVGAVQRASHGLVNAGGKGLNAARALRALGGDPLCLGPLGGPGGRLLAVLAQDEGVRAAWTWIAGPTRTCVILIPEAGGESTVVNEPGPILNAAEWAALAADCLRETRPEDSVAFCGSLPGGVGAPDFCGLLAALVAGRRQVWVDSSGPALAAAAGVAGVNLKINGAEAAALLGLPVINGAAEAAHAVRLLLAQGHPMTVVTLGALGAVAADAENCWRARPPALQAVSAVGSGDAFLGAWLLAREQGRPIAECLRLATASGAANALAAGGGRVRPAVTENLLPQIVCQACGEDSLP
jgi:1-phosphofructokinase family hexose kinase